MRTLVLLLSIVTCLQLSAQQIISDPREEKFHSERYVSLNPFSFLEGEMAIGAGFSNRFSRRSEYFTELSYLVKNPMYEFVNALHGFRVIGQYRYHYLPRVQREGAEHFVGVEFRLKQYYFADSLGFINASTHDTLSRYPYHATATVFGGAVFVGISQNLSANRRWRVEFTFGFGIKQKNVSFNNIPRGYEPEIIPPKEWGYVPKIYESKATVYIPSALRIQYRIR